MSSHSHQCLQNEARTEMELESDETIQDKLENFEKQGGKRDRIIKLKEEIISLGEKIEYNKFAIKDINREIKLLEHESKYAEQSLCKKSDETLKNEDYITYVVANSEIRAWKKQIEIWTEKLKKLEVSLSRKTLELYKLNSLNRK